MYRIALVHIAKALHNPRLRYCHLVWGLISSYAYQSDEVLVYSRLARAMVRANTLRGDRQTRLFAYATGLLWDPP
jgi:hypothetical protein